MQLCFDLVGQKSSMLKTVPVNHEYIDGWVGWDGDSGNTHACQFQMHHLFWLNSK